MSGFARGRLNPRSKLNSADVQLILLSPLSEQELARRLSVSDSCIEDVRAGRTWRHILPGVRRTGLRDCATLNLNLETRGAA